MLAIQLEKLLSILPTKKVVGNTDIKISAISQNSKQTGKNTLFVAIPGFVVDGLKFIPEAIKNGATAIVAEKDFECPTNVTKIIVPSGMNHTVHTGARKALALLSSRFYDHPSEKLKLIGITGTNGKTTTVYLTSSILKSAWFKTGLSTTIETRTQKTVVPSERTTNDALATQKFLNELVKEKSDYAVLEVSSHGLSLDRLLGCKFNVTLFTNLTHDHLDFHKTLTSYRNAKIKLFKMLKKDGFGIVNIDDKNSKFFINALKGKKYLTYGLNKKAQITAEKIKYSADGISCRIITPKGNFNLSSSLSGTFNLYNLLAACSIGISQNIKLIDIKKGLENVYNVPGRFEYVRCGQPFKIIIDYAHSPDSLEKTIKTARELTKGRVMVAFGATGNRDKTKRPIMGQIVAELSDFFIITNDDPHDEDPMSIIKQVEEGVKNVETKHALSYKIIPGRKKAISELIKMAKPNDFLIIAGKGHETKQVFKDKVIEFNDKKVVEEILNETFRI